MDKYTKRLLDEWVKHKKLIICLDFDDTIRPYNLSDQEECDDTIALIKECQDIGAHVILFTARREEMIQAALDYCNQKSLQIDAVNKGIPIEGLYFGHDAKPYANIYVDDRADLHGAKDSWSYED